MPTQIPVFPEVVGHEEGVKIFATIIAIAMLRAFSAEKAAAWSLIEAKGLKWLGDQGIDFEPLIARAIAELTK
jgi:hypothetical protein